MHLCGLVQFGDGHSYSNQMQNAERITALGP